MHISGPLQSWRDEVGRRFLNLDFKPTNDDPFRLSLDILLSDNGIGVGRTRHTSGCTFRDADMAKADTHSVSLIVPRCGTLNIRQANTDLKLAGSSAALVRNYEPGSVHARSSCDYFGVVIAESELQAMQIESGLLTGRVWQGSNDALRLLRSYMSSLERAALPSSAEVRHAASRHILELVVLAARNATSIQRQAEGSVLEQARLHLAHTFIAEHFTEPDLSISRVAASQGISPRQLQLLFEKSGMHYTALVNEFRLQNAYRLLRSISMRDCAITDIALASGFSDISHFNRMFRRRFDATPSAVRSLTGET